MATTGKRGNPGTDLTDNHNKVFMEQMDADAVELTAVTAAALANTTHVTGDGSDHADVADNTADLTAVGVGVAGTNVTAVEYGGMRHQTTLTLTDVVLGAPTAGGNSAHGALIYTLPAGVQVFGVSYMDIGLTIGTVTSDAPDVGVGSVIGSGAIALLNGTTMEDYITAQTWNVALDGTHFAAVGPIDVTAGFHVGIGFNAATDVKEIYLNAADGWNAGVTGNLTASGTITFTWDTIV